MSRILVIEDERLILEEVSEWLQFEGYDVMTAEDGFAGVEVARAQLPDLIVCDITMPRMDGYQVLAELRQHPETSPIPLIFLTARADRSFMRQGMELGADDYLTKPFRQDELLAAIRTRLQRHAGISEAYKHELEAAKVKLVRLVAHELKSPITSMRLVKDLIERQIDQLSKEEIKEFLAIVSNGTERLNHIIEQTVYMSYLENGVLSRNTIAEQGSIIHVWQFVPTVINLARRFAFQGQNAEVTTDIRDGGASIFGDLNALRHAFAELIGAVLDVNDDRNSIFVQQWRANGLIWITVLYQGHGAAPDKPLQMEELFQPPYGDPMPRSVQLGLSLTRSIVDAHGGSIDVTSTENQVIQISVCFPAMQTAEEDTNITYSQGS